MDFSLFSALRKSVLGLAKVTDSTEAKIHKGDLYLRKILLAIFSRKKILLPKEKLFGVLIKNYLTN